MMRNSFICKLINVQASMKENNEKKIKKEDEHKLRSQESIICNLINILKPINKSWREEIEDQHF